MDLNTKRPRASKSITYPTESNASLPICAWSPPRRFASPADWSSCDGHAYNSRGKIRDWMGLVGGYPGLINQPRFFFRIPDSRIAIHLSSKFDFIGESPNWVITPYHWNDGFISIHHSIPMKHGWHPITPSHPLDCNVSDLLSHFEPPSWSRCRFCQPTLMRISNGMYFNELFPFWLLCIYIYNYINTLINSVTPDTREKCRIIRLLLGPTRRVFSESTTSTMSNRSTNVNDMLVKQCRKPSIWVDGWYQP